MILAADALSRATGGHGLFRTMGTGGAPAPVPEPGRCGCAITTP